MSPDPAAPPPLPAAEPQPRSPRLRRWARILLIVLGCLAALIGGWVWHIKRQEARMLAHVEELRLAWERSRLMPAPEDNAADLYRQAFDKLVESDKVRDVRKRAYDGQLDFRSAEIEEILGKNAECLGLVDEALRRPHCQLMMDFSRGVLGKPDADVGKVLRLGILLDLRARHSVLAKKPGEALTDVLALFMLAHHASECESILGQMGCHACVEWGFKALEVLLGRHQLSAAELERAFAEVAKIAPAGTSLVACLRAEKVVMLITTARVATCQDAMTQLISKSGERPERRSSSDYVQFAARWTGLARREVVNLEGAFDKLIAFAERSSRGEDVEFNEVLAEVMPDRSHHSWILGGRVITAIVMPSLASACTGGSSKTSPVQLDLARIGLALELSRLRHGQHPESLEALCADMPEKFLAVPQDPFAKAPLRYERTAAATRVWSVENDNIRPGEKPRTDLVIELPK